MIKRASIGQKKVWTIFYLDYNQMNVIYQTEESYINHQIDQIKIVIFSLK